MSDKSRRYLSFRVGQQWYGVDVGRVIEVLHMVALTELPAATPDVLGLLVVREVVMPVIDLRRRFGLTPKPLRLDTPIIALYSDGLRPAGSFQNGAAQEKQTSGPIGLVVDEVDDVIDVTAAQIAVYGDTDSPYVTQAARLPNRLLLVLDTALLRREVSIGEKANGKPSAGQPADRPAADKQPAEEQAPAEQAAEKQPGGNSQRSSKRRTKTKAADD
ncbi:MAG: chemotaxis protein CheW [Anaerolineae bacterium]|nr:chemotaxis protein CheW [Anaerolineae bacterium]